MSFAQQIVINELSQGPSGTNGEFVELVIVGTPTCGNSNCIDLRGWIIDDNNGDYGSNGIATGCVRFSNDPFWSCIGYGTIIVIYNDADPNPNLPADDLTDSNGDCVYVIPISSSLFEKNITQPNGSNNTYPTTGFSSGGDWVTIGMRNGGDSFQIIDPANPTTPVFVISYGDNSNSAGLNFAGSMSGKVIYFNNSLSDDPNDVNNYTVGSVSSGDETPGQPNNAANATWISSMNNNCTPISSLSVSVTAVNPSCNGTSDGSINISVSSGTPTYSYVWNTGATDNPYTGLYPGVYDYTVSDAGGCSASGSVTLSAPASFNVTITKNDISCFAASDGTAEVSVTSGNTALNYIWTNGATTSSISGLAQGTYSVTVSDAGACNVSVLSTTIQEPAPLTISPSNYLVVDVSCNGGNDGSAVIVPQGGTPPYSTFWSPTPGTGQGTLFPSNMTAGAYTVTVTDDNGCTFPFSLTVNEPLPFQTTITTTAANCGQKNGSATIVNSTGGTSPYTYIWNTPSGMQTTASATGLLAGSYVVTIVDDNNCVYYENTSVADIPGPSINVSVTSPLCYGSANGSATAQASANGGSTNFTYLWSNGMTENTITGLFPGNYLVSATDANGCIAVGSATITQPQEILLTVSAVDNQLCIGQCTDISIQASGGQSPYTYIWQNLSSTQTVNVCPSQSTIYSAYVEDANGCQSSFYNLNVNVYDSLRFLDVSASLNPLCEGQSVSLYATADPSSGTGGPYTYYWQNIGPGQTVTTTPNDYPSPHWYIVSLSDGCSPIAVDSVQVTYYTKPSVSINVSNPGGCPPVSASFTANINSSYGTTGCLWRFEDGDIVYDATCSGVSKDFTNPGGNDVYLTVMETNGCQTEIAQPSAIVVRSLPNVNFYMLPENASHYTNYTTVLYPTIQFVDSTYTYATAITNWNWTFYGNSDTSGVLGYADEQNPIFVFPVDTGVYPVKLEVVTQQGCKADTTINLIITGDLSFYIPNAFTPDGDGTNDYFGPEGVGIDENYQLYIFNRWGQLIWNNVMPGEKWDGTVRSFGDGKTLAKDDVYVWKLVFKTSFLTGENERRYIKYGVVTLLK